MTESASEKNLSPNTDFVLGREGLSKLRKVVVSA